MRSWVERIAVVLVVAGATSSAFFFWPSGGEAVRNKTNEELSREAVSSEDAVARRAMVELRRRGPAAHAVLLHTHADGVRALRQGRANFENADRLRSAIDRVSGQRDGHASGLYWHTDLDAAMRDARHSGRPILSLRLLGRLDEELSCANSRFFRVVLYSDPNVAARLREHFVLHWSSERPAPRITIDMGDGRRIVRTITGNSIHYVLDSDGRPIDGIAGLYAPRAFLAALEEAERAFTCGSFEGRPAWRPECLVAHHTVAGTALRRRWDEMTGRDPSMVGFDEAVAAIAPEESTVQFDAPPAYAAMPLTVGKMAVEQPMLEVMGIGGPRRRSVTREPDFARAGVLLYGAEPMSANGRALLRLKTGSHDIDRTQANLMRDALADSARNELLFHRAIHDRFATRAEETSSFASMNEWVYRALMRTPASDPWLGLAPDERWDAIER